ncbi:MAG: hypothetical protein LBE27_01460, partial [Deltaproteobacteria bacterium]|nr:hypothetical protein [Deltaproteobacteria bacterium]
KNATILALDTYGGQIKSIGDSFDLISATNPILVNGEYSQMVEGRHGDLISYDYLLEVDPKDDKKLKATIVGMSISPGKESVLDGLR